MHVYIVGVGGGGEGGRGLGRECILFAKDVLIANSVDLDRFVIHIVTGQISERDIMVLKLDKV